MLNPFKTSRPWPRSHYDLIEHYHTQYDRQIANGEYQPFLYPWGTLGALVVIIYLCIPHQGRPWLKKCRYLALAWITGFAAYTIFCTRAKGMAPSLGIGLISAWSVIWIAAILVCNDAQTDFQRIERLEGVFGGSQQDKKDQVDESKRQNGTSDDLSTKGDLVKGTLGPRDRTGEFAWQPYPLTPFIERLDWVCDIFCNFRGAGWNWRTSALPPPPKEIQLQLSRNSSSPLPKTSFRSHTGQVASYTTRNALFTANIKTLIQGYITLDMLKTTMIHDPYFWGLVDAPAPLHFPFSLVSSSHVLTHIFRLFLSMWAVKTALQTIFSLGPLFFSYLLGPALLGARAEPWMYPETWSSYSVVLDRGLAGWWGNWWHQTFRFAFEQPGKVIVEKLGLDKRGALAKAMVVFIAFGLSGIVHASGSITCAGPTNPFAGSFMFFIVQAFGIIVEQALSVVIVKTWFPFLSKMPQPLKRTWTFVYVHTWFYFTAHLLCDDFARGGVWLFEPIPISPLRGLGFGAHEKDGWWCWWGPTTRWHRGETLWGTGVAF